MFGLYICGTESAVLEIEDRLAERLALAGIFDRVVEGALRRRLGADRDRQPFLRQLAHQIDEALPLFAEAVGDRHADVVEEQLRRIGLVLPALVEVAAADRKSDVSGKGVSIREDLGGGSFLKKKTTK